MGFSYLFAGTTAFLNKLGKPALEPPVTYLMKLRQAESLSSVYFTRLGPHLPPLAVATFASFKASAIWRRVEPFSRMGLTILNTKDALLWA